MNENGDRNKRYSFKVTVKLTAEVKWNAAKGEKETISTLPSSAFRRRVKFITNSTID
jgi:hypothetical protein